MREANAYERQNNEEELFLEGVDKVVPIDGHWELENIIGEKKIIKGFIEELSLVDYKIIIEKE